MRHLLRLVAGMFVLASATATGSPFFFSTGNPDDRMGTASRPTGNGKIEIEAADDFVLTAATDIASATFTGLLVGQTPRTAADVTQVVVEIYRVFPADSDVSRTSGPPTFSTPLVPTRVNSPSDAAFASRDTALGTLTFTATALSNVFTAGNSVLNGIKPTPNQLTHGEGPVTGLEVEFDAGFATSFSLPAGHYFFVPQVEVNDGEFYWLSAPKPIVAPGTPFLPDLQEWIRNENLAPDWLRVGTDIVGGTPAPTFNATFSLTGEVAGASVSEPPSLALSALALLLGAGAAVGCRARRRAEG